MKHTQFTQVVSQMKLRTSILGTLSALGMLVATGNAYAAYSNYDPYDYGTNYYNSSYDLPYDSGLHNYNSEQAGYICHYRNSNNECMEYSYVSGGTSNNYYVPHYRGKTYYDDTYYRSRSSMRSYCYDRYDDRYDSRTCRDYREDYDDRDCYNDGYYNSNDCRTTNTRRITYTRSTRYDRCDDYRYDDDDYYYGSRYRSSGYYEGDCRYDDYYTRNRSAGQYCYDRYDSRYETLYCQRYRRDDLTGDRYRYDYDYRYNNSSYYNGYYR